jgi:hypothetical protein
MTSLPPSPGQPATDPGLNVYELVLPVIGADSAETGELRIREACGTAFTIGGGVYLTAGHVWENALAFPKQGIGILPDQSGPPGHMLICRVDDSEVLKDYDLAILKSAAVSSKTFPWSTADLTLLEEVRAFGYPYAFDPASGTLNVRGFKGEIVGSDTLARLGTNPAINELSFSCPRGLSGAPLIRNKPKTQITGIVLGNQITEMIVFQEKETLVERNRETVLIKTESLHLGIALRASEVVAVRSELLGCAIGEWLQRYGLLAQAE